MEIILAVLAIIVTIIIGLWQIYLTKRQVISKEGNNDSSDLLRVNWNKLDPDLQDTLSIAYNQALRDGTEVIRTRYFISALMRLRPGSLPEILDRLPSEALPEPTDKNLKLDKNILEGNPTLSSCVEDSINALSRKSDYQNKISATDMFVDIAKHGTGKSVARLRTHGVTPEKVDEIINQLGWHLIER